MAEIKKTIKISAPISPYSTTDTYPTHLSIYGKGGVKSVGTIADRDLIPDDRREEGMIVYVAENKTAYALYGGIANANWVTLDILVSGPGAGQLRVTEIIPQNPTPATLWFNPSDGNIYSRNPENNQWIQYIPPTVDGGDF